MGFSCFPEILTIGWGCGILTTFVSMPETAVNEDGGFVFGQNDVGANRSTPHLYPLPVRRGEEIGWNRNSNMQTKSESHSMQKRANNFFGRGILAADARHVPRASFLCEFV